MSGFHIPGLGQARPNESLPPLPADVLVAAASLGESDIKAETAAAPSASSCSEVVQPENVTDTEAINVDRHASPGDSNMKVETADAPIASICSQVSQPDIVTGTEAMNVDQRADLSESDSKAKTAAVPSASTHAQVAEPEHVTGTEAMNVDRPASPPSLTSALEAAIGGLDSSVDAPGQTQTHVSESALGNGQAEAAEWEMDSSPYESSSSDSSSSDSSDEDTDDDGYKLLGVEETARLLMEAEGGTDDEGDRNQASTAAQLRTRNEVAQEILPKPDVTITEAMKIEELGSVETIIENIMLIRAITPGEYQVLDTGSVLCSAERVVVGVVAETMGKVLQPMYTVYFNSAEEIKELGLQVGSKIFYPVDHATYVFTQPLKSLKGSDASNLHDEEIGAEEMEFSDDEKEAEYRRSLKQKKKDKWKSKNDAAAGGNGRDRHPLSRQVSADGGLNYDDVDGPYKPLSRPPGFGTGPVSTETYEPGARPGPRRGGADGRGRGGRGKSSGRGSGRGGSGRGAYGGPPTDGYSLPPSGSQPYMTQLQHQTAPSPSVPSFGFPVSSWPQPPASHGQQGPAAPPPPPGWPMQSQAQAGAFNINSAIMAALMSQMQQHNGQPPHPPPPPPPPFGGHGL